MSKKPPSLSGLKGQGRTTSKDPQLVKARKRMAALRARKRAAKERKKLLAGPPPPKEGSGDPDQSSPGAKVKPIPLEVRVAEAMEVIRSRWQEFDEADQPDCLLAGYGCEMDLWYAAFKPEARSRSLGKFNFGGLCDWCYRRAPAYGTRGGL